MPQPSLVLYGTSDQRLALTRGLTIEIRDAVTRAPIKDIRIRLIYDGRTQSLSFDASSLPSECETEILLVSAGAGGSRAALVDAFRRQNQR